MGRAGGFFITFEGTEGSGKSTLIQKLAVALKPETDRIVVTREPGGQPISEKIRALLLHEGMHPSTELFLYEAARAEHLHHTIKPALENGALLLCDRFTDSTLAYQGSARGISWERIRMLNKIATDGITPDLTIWLDLDPAVGLSRAREFTRFEAEGVKFQAKVRAGYARIARSEPKRWLKLRSDRMTADEIAERVLDVVRERWVNRGSEKKPTTAKRKKGGPSLK
ncbi:MAG: dTMP kinase [Bdellovibrionota bacterium]